MTDYINKYQLSQINRCDIIMLQPQVNDRRDTGKLPIDHFKLLQTDTGIARKNQFIAQRMSQHMLTGS